MTSTRIMVSDRRRNFVIYSAKCASGISKEMMMLELEKYYYNTIHLNIYGNFYFNEKFYDEGFFTRVWKRIVTSFKFLFGYSLYAEYNFVLMGEDQIKDFINAIETGLFDLQEKERKSCISSSTNVETVAMNSQ